MTDRKWRIGPGDNAPVYPWYKERLRTKCLKDPVQKLQLSGALNGRRWRFMTAGLDDFRDGYPVPQAGTLTQPHRGTEAAIFGLSREPVKSPKRRFTKEQVCFSKQNCLQETQRRFVDAVERSLSRHPLALYPHLGSGMAPELFDDVLSVLDPAMHIRIETPRVKQQECSKEKLVPCEGLVPKTLPEQITESPNFPVSYLSRNVDNSNGFTNFQAPLYQDFSLLLFRSSRQDEVQNSISQNPYKLQEAKEIFGKEDKRIHSSYLDKEINRVTKLFCDWVSSLGEETNDITESTILDLFASGCEKKPVLTFQDVGAKEKTELLHKDYLHNMQLKDSGLNKVYIPRKKTTYGAWYLNPNTWKKQPGNEPLRDQSVTEDSELVHQPTEKDEELKQIYGAQAFKQFIINNGLRVPGFLRSVFPEEEQESRTRGTAATASALTCPGAAML